MDEIISLLRAELTLCVKLADLLEKQREALKANIDGRAVNKITQDIDALLIKIGAVERQKTDFLKKANARTMAEALNREPYSAEKMRAKGYLARLNELLGVLRKSGDVNKELLKRDTNYPNFNINVLTQATARPGYDEPETSIQGRKLFDESV